MCKLTWNAASPMFTKKYQKRILRTYVYLEIETTFCMQKLIVFLI